MALPTLNVTPGTGATINTLPPGGQAAPASSLPMSLDTTVETAVGTSGSQAVTVQGAAAGVAVPTAPAPGENHLGEVGGNSAAVTASLTRVANTTAYAVGQLVANSATAGSVVPLSFAAARKNAGTGRVTRVRLSSTNTAATGSTFRVHFFRMTPTTTVGDGGAFAGAVNGVTAFYTGSFDITLDKSFSDGAKGIGLPNTGAYMTFDTATGTQTIFALIEARSAYTPASGETLSVTIETDRD